MRWVEQSPDLPLQPLAALVGRDPVLARTLNGIRREDGPVVAIATAAEDDALHHLAGHADERGGLLLGEVFAEGDDVAGCRLVLITQAIPAMESEGTGISLRMGSAVWQQAQSRRGALERVVGWFHSHPGIGAFFSETDRRTQRAFFPHVYSVGWVVDPVYRESAIFLGAESTPPANVLYRVTGAGAMGSDGASRYGAGPTTSMPSTK